MKMACSAFNPANRLWISCAALPRIVKPLLHGAHVLHGAVCASGCACNPTRATPVHKVITDKPIIKVPGCPPIAEVMTGVITYMLTFDRIQKLDRQGRPKMFMGNAFHDKCYRRPHFDAGQFVESWDDESARKGYCLYKMGCKGPGDL